ncbi:MAG TPA: flagellar biosynthetic protein FliO [Acidobacteriaceae bacterium]
MVSGPRGAVRVTPGLGLRAAAGQVWSVGTLLWVRIEAIVAARRAAQRGRYLQLIETVSLGEKRFVAVVQVERARFLVGGGASGVALLARLDGQQAAPGSFAESLAASDAQGSAGEGA